MLRDPMDGLCWNTPSAHVAPIPRRGPLVAPTTLGYASWGLAGPGLARWTRSLGD